MSSRQEFDRGGSRLRAHHRLHVCCFVAAVLGTVRRVDLVVEVRVGGREGHISSVVPAAERVTSDSRQSTRRTRHSSSGIERWKRERGDAVNCAPWGIVQPRRQDEVVVLIMGRVLEP